MLKEQPIKKVILREPTFLPGGVTETTLDQIRTPGIKLYRLKEDRGVMLHYKGEEAFIPDAQIRIYNLAKNDK